VRPFIFQSEFDAASSCAGDLDTRLPPAQDGRWHPVGIVRTDADPSRTFKRATIAKAVSDRGCRRVHMAKRPAGLLVFKD
jgi:hypothetical protein